jgi:hypothetical protein
MLESGVNRIWIPAFAGMTDISGCIWPNQFIMLSPAQCHVAAAAVVEQA